MDRHWILFGVPFLVTILGTLGVLAGEALHLSLLVTAGGLVVVFIGVLGISAGVYYLPDPDEPEAGAESH